MKLSFIYNSDSERDRQNTIEKHRQVVTQLLQMGFKQEKIEAAIVSTKSLEIPDLIEELGSLAGNLNIILPI